MHLSVPVYAYVCMCVYMSVYMCRSVYVYECVLRQGLTKYLRVTLKLVSETLFSDSKLQEIQTCTLKICIDNQN